MGNEETKKNLDIEDNINDFIYFAKSRMTLYFVSGVMFALMLVILCIPFYKIGGTSFGIMDISQKYISRDRAWLESSMIGSLVNGTLTGNPDNPFDPGQLKLMAICLCPFCCVVFVARAVLHFSRLSVLSQTIKMEIRNKSISKDIRKRFGIGKVPIFNVILEIIFTIFFTSCVLILNYTYAQQLVSVSGGIMEYNPLYFFMALLCGFFGVISTIASLPPSIKYYRLFNVIFPENISTKEKL